MRVEFSFFKRVKENNNEGENVILHLTINDISLHLLHPLRSDAEQTPH